LFLNKNQYILPIYGYGKQEVLPNSRDSLILPPCIAVSRQYFYFFAEPLRIQIASLGLFLFVRFDNIVWGVISSMLAAVHAWWQNEQCPRQIILRRKSTTSTCESACDVKSHSKHKAVLARRLLNSNGFDQLARETMIAKRFP
jgi:hypothetical protein